jgi:D-sedoheptulose 7-phosphate isomerase
MESWTDYMSAMLQACAGLCVTGLDGQPISMADGFARWIELTRAIHDRSDSLYFIGNGASAAMASHMAADATKNGQLRAFTFNDPSLLTATGNDVSFENVFALPLSRLARPGDMLVTISSSGNSPNIVAALETARARGLTIITLSGKGSDNRCRSLGHLNFYIPAGRYGWVESSHQVVLHYWLDNYLNLYGSGAL